MRTVGAIALWGQLEARVDSRSEFIFVPRSEHCDRGEASVDGMCVCVCVCVRGIHNTWVRVRGKAAGMRAVTVRINVRVEVGVGGFNSSVNANVRVTCQC